MKNKDSLQIVFAGHVDHGKSTIIGRLLVDTDSLPTGKLEFVKKMCQNNSKPFEYAFLLDALKEEQSQGITIDSSRCFFETDKRRYIIIDAPGHIEFLRNMVTGASRASAAFIVIDAHEGVMENSKRHGYLLAMLGIKQINVLVNKMDLVSFSETDFLKIKENYSEFLNSLSISDISFIPVSGFYGDNVSQKSLNMSWYDGKTVLEALESFEINDEVIDSDFRMSVQDVYKFTGKGDERRIIAGMVDYGMLSVGDEILFSPSGKKSKVKSIENFEREEYSVKAGYSVGFTLYDQLYIKRGEIISKKNETHPICSKKLIANIFWMGKERLVIGKDYILKLGTQKTVFQIEEILFVMNTAELSTDQYKKEIDQNEIGRVVLVLKNILAFEISDKFPNFGRFVVVDDYEICGGGIIIDYPDKEISQLRENVNLRNLNWINNSVSSEMRCEKYGHKSCLIIISGKKGSGRKKIARLLETELFSSDKIVFYMGMGNIVYGVDADIKCSGNENRKEHIRRLSEVCNLMLQTGLILIVTIQEIECSDLEIFDQVIGEHNRLTVWLGSEYSCNADLKFDVSNSEYISDEIINLLQSRSIIN